MKHIVIVMGTGLSGLGGVMSKHGRVTLIQIGLMRHTEVWEDGRMTFSGPEIEISNRIRKLDDALLGTIRFFYTIKILRQHLRGNPADLVLSSFYSSVLASVVLQKAGRVRRTVFFILDHLPPRGSLLTRAHRKITGGLARVAAKLSDEAWVISRRIHTGRAGRGNFLMPFPVGCFPSPASPREEVGYIGYASEDHALDVLFDVCRRHNFRLNLVGDSPYLQSIKHLAPAGTRFHGRVNEDERVAAIFAKCFCGYAVYRDVSPASYSYYGFPSKTLSYLASNVPVVTTDAAEFNENFEIHGIGRVVEPTPEAIESAVLQLKSSYTAYSQAIDRFREEWNAGVEAFYRERMAVLLLNNQTKADTRE